MVDTIEALVHHFEPTMHSYKLRVDCPEPRVDRLKALVLSAKSRMHLRKAAVDQLRVLAEVLLKCFCRP
jgi:hypothetical protein